jgi:Tetratricopeptide repeat
VLAEAGDLDGAQSVCATGLARSRNAGDLYNLTALLVRMAVLDVRAGRPEEAAVHLQEALQIDLRTGKRAEVINALDCCGNLCASTGRHAEAITLWAAQAACYQYGGVGRYTAGSTAPRPARAPGPPGARA